MTRGQRGRPHSGARPPRGSTCSSGPGDAAVRAGLGDPNTLEYAKMHLNTVRCTKEYQKEEYQTPLKIQWYNQNFELL